MSWHNDAPASSGKVWKTTWYNRKRSRPGDTRFFSTGDVAPSFFVNGRPYLKTSKRGTEYIVFYDKAHSKWSAASSHEGVTVTAVPEEHQRTPAIEEATEAETAEFYGDLDDSDYSDGGAVEDEIEDDPPRRRIPRRRIQTRARAQRSDVNQTNIIGNLMGRRTRRATAAPLRYTP
jgi:hypothetical protein